DLKRLKRDIESGSRGVQTEALTGMPRKGKYLIIAASCALVLLAVLTFFSFKGGETWQRFFGPGIPQQKNLVVLPFTALDSQPGEQAFCDGFTDTVTTKLANIESLHVPLAEEVRNKHINTFQEARNKFGANLVLAASWQRSQNSARINLKLLDAKTGKQLRTETVTEPVNDLFRLQ